MSQAEVSRAAEFFQSLKRSGIPVDGVSGTGPTCRIDYQAAATAQQRADGDAARASFDWTPETTQMGARRRAKSLLTSNDPQTVMLRGILKVLFQSLAEVRTKVVPPLPNRTFAEAMQAVADAIDAGQGEA